MQEKADISNTPEVFLLIKYLVKESLRCMISTHPDYSPAQVPSYLHSCDTSGEQKINKGSC
uniref:Uncharacterized protein n=1 Tax=Nomascus leucogenys TaxID=61853 RepID=A0A2I3HJ06_NOMLE